MSLSITLAGTTVELSAERVLYWPEEQTLFAADLHWGKSAAFRAAGFPLPHRTTANDLARLSDILHRLGAKRLVLLGDLFHARAAKAAATLNAIRRWRADHPDLSIVLVRGNHDKSAGDPPRDLSMQCVDEPWPIGPFAARHFPTPTEGGYVLAGHLHPAVRLHEGGRRRLVLPCFHCRPRVAVLPAFGSFTGNAVVRPCRGDRVYVIAEDEVIQTPIDM